MQRIPVGVVEKYGEGYVGTCEEIGTTSFGRTVEEAFANLRVVTWRQIELQSREVRAASMDSWRPKEGRPVYATAEA